RTRPRWPSVRVTPPAYSVALGDASVSVTCTFTPGRLTPTSGRIVPPLASNQLNTVRIACSRVISGAFGSVLIAGPVYAYWSVDGFPAIEAPLAIALEIDAT